MFPPAPHAVQAVQTRHIPSRHWVSIPTDMVSSASVSVYQTPEKTWSIFSNIYHKYLNNSKKNLPGNKSQIRTPTGRYVREDNKAQMEKRRKVNRRTTSRLGRIYNQRTESSQDTVARQET